MSIKEESNAWLQKSDGGRIPLEGNLSIGRTSANTLVLDDEFISGRHALIHAEENDEYLLIDRESRNGSYLNGRHVRRPTRLRHGDEIRFGPFTFVFCQSSPITEPTTSGEQTMHDIRPALCWLLVADVVDSTRMSRGLGEKESAERIGNWFVKCRQVVESSDGTMNNATGDGFFAFWHTKNTEATDLLAAISALQSFQEEEDLRFRLALHLGETWIGGASSLGEESLSGPAVTFVFRMEKLAAKLKQRFLASEEVAHRFEGIRQLSCEGESEVPGFDGQYRFFSFPKRPTQ